MDIHHDTSLRFILEDDSISSTPRVRIHSCLSKGVGLWLVVRPSIRLFYIMHYVFTSRLHFRLCLIEPSTSNLLTCECGHGLDVFGTHLIHCMFRSEWISTHAVI